MTAQEKAIWHAIKAIQQRLGIAAGGVTPSVHSPNHGAGSSDPLDILTLDGYLNSSPATQFLREDAVWATPDGGSGGSGVTGPGTSTDLGIARWNGGGGDSLENTSGPLLEDDGRISTLTDPSGAQDAATKAYVDAAAAGGGLFEVAGSWVWSTNVTLVDFDVSGYADLIIYASAITLASSAARVVQLSVDGGGTFYSASGDYKLLQANGQLLDDTGIFLHSTSSTAARYGVAEIYGANINGIVKPCFSLNRIITHLFVGSQSPITHVRVTSNGGGNMTGGSITVLGRPL